MLFHKIRSFGDKIALINETKNSYKNISKIKIFK